MMMTPTIEFREASSREDYQQIARLAGTIWREHYTPIIGADQVAYMLKHFQSAGAIEQQVGNGMLYYTMLSDPHPIGYLAIDKRENELFLSKIYLLREYRGLGLGKVAMEFISDKARELACNRIALTVNKNNTRSIDAYLRMGFVREKALVTDIGGGFVMDDYRMVLDLG